MSQRLNRILEYEKRLIQDRQQLLELLSESDGTDEELARYKLECFQKEIAFMNRQVELLKQETRNLEPMQQEIQAPQPTYVQSEPVKPEQKAQARAVQPEQTTPPKPEVSELQTEQPAQQGAFNKQYENLRLVAQQAQTAMAQTSQVVKKKDLEQTVGKSLMGIFASVLIFISLILFATLLLPYFNDTAKMVTTYLVSFAFLGVGLYKMKKDKTNRFYIALTGCGIGALYISLLLSNMYFKVLGDIPLYALICVWGVAVCFFARQQSMIFQIIGELGITIAMIFGCLLCVANEDTTKFLALIIFYVISAGAFYVVHFKREFGDNLIHQIFNVINVFLLAVSCFELVGNGLNHLESWSILVIIAVSVASTLWHSTKKEGISFGVFAVAYLLMGYGMLETLLLDADMFERLSLVYAVTAYIVSMILLAVFEGKKSDEKFGKYLVQAVLLFKAAQALDYHIELYNYGMVLLLIMPVLLAGFLRKNKAFQFGGLVLLTVYTFEYYGYTTDANMHYLLETLAIVTGFVLLWWKKEQYSAVFKYVLHVIALLFIFDCTSEVVFELLPIKQRSGLNDIPGICNYVLFTIFNIGMMKSRFGKNLLTGEKENPVVYNIANLLAMIVGTFMIADSGDGFWQMLLIVTVLGTFFINSKNLLEKRNSLLSGIYVGIKFTILLIVILDAFYVENYVISIACLLLAIASIVLGFVGEYKSLRIFGLLLSMISIFKLIMVDISYDNTFGHALSFFVSGILCFVISLIYNYIDKRLAERA